MARHRTIIVLSEVLGMPMGVYKQYVNDENDLVGQLAYCMYKKSKIEFKKKHEKEKGQPPSYEEQKTYRDNCLLQIPNLRDSANRILNGFVAQSHESLVKTLLNQYHQPFFKSLEGKLLKKAEKHFSAHKPGFWARLKENLLLNVCSYLIVSTLILFLLSLIDQDVAVALKNLIRKIVNPIA